MSEINSEQFSLLRISGFLSQLDDAARIPDMGFLSAAKLSLLCMSAGLFISLVRPAQAEPSDICKLGSDAFRQRDLPKAEALLKQCISTKPPQIHPYLDLCALYQMQGNTKALYDIASQGLQRFPEERRFYLTVGNQAGQEKHYERAIEIFAEGFRRWPDDLRFREGLASAHLLLGMQFLDQAENQEAELHLRQASKLEDKDIDAHLNLGRALQNLNQSVEALAEFDRVLALGPQTPLARFHRGFVLYTLHEYDAAIADLSQEVKVNPAYPPSFLFRGEAFMAKGDWANAIADLDIAVIKMPESPKAIYAKARCLNQLGRLKEAEMAFRKTLELDSASPDALNGLARLLSSTGREREAEALFQKALELNRKARSAGPAEIRFESAQSKKIQ